MYIDRYHMVFKRLPCYISTFGPWRVIPRYISAFSARASLSCLAWGISWPTRAGRTLENYRTSLRTILGLEKADTGDTGDTRGPEGPSSGPGGSSRGPEGPQGPPGARKGPRGLGRTFGPRRRVPQELPLCRVQCSAVHSAEGVGRPCIEHR